MKKALIGFISLVTIICLFIFGKLFAFSTKESKDSLVLQSTNDYNDTTYKHSHKSHYSGHISHYSQYILAHNDSILGLNKKIENKIRINLEKHPLPNKANNNYSLVLYRAYISKMRNTRRDENTYSGKALTLVLQEDKKYNLWLFIPLESNENIGYYRYGHYRPLNTYNTPESIWGKGPEINDKFDLPTWLINIKNQLNGK